MSGDEQYEKAREAAYRYLACRSRSVLQVAAMLHRKGFDGETSARVTDHLKEYGLLNDKDFAQQYLLKKPLRPRGVMAADLRKQGVDRHVIEELLAGVDFSAEMSMALTLAQDRRKRLGDGCTMAKMAAFLSRRGFSPEIVETVCNCLENMRYP
jgi:regulatory protein